MRRLDTDDELDEMLYDPCVLIFKHSTMCPVSGLAMREVMALADAHPDLAIGVIDVISSRPLSRRVAEELDVRHESPQAILVRDGQAVWHASHFGVMRERIERAVRGE